MPTLDKLDKESQSEESLAVMAEALYLANLLILPGIAFLILLRLYLRHRHSASGIGLAHLQQTLSGSIWAGILLVIVNVLILLLAAIRASIPGSSSSSTSPWPTPPWCSMVPLASPRPCPASAGVFRSLAALYPLIAPERASTECLHLPILC
jgi:hypothetical protein